jgi:hypothetical protein
VTLIGRTLRRTPFAERSDEVARWALVHLHYRSGDRCPATNEQVDKFAPTEAMVPVLAEAVLYG